MRKIFLLAIAATALCSSVPSQAHEPGETGGGYGPGWGMGPGMMGGQGGYGPGSMMGLGYGGGYGPGMMYGQGPDGRTYRGPRSDGGQVYRGKKLCWHGTNADRGTGFYEPCGN